MCVNHARGQDWRAYCVCQQRHNTVLANDPKTLAHLQNLGKTVMCLYRNKLNESVCCVQCARSACVWLSVLAVCSRASCHACICLLSTVCFCCCCYCCCQCVATLSVCSWCQSHIECIIIVDSFLLLLAPNTVSYGKNVHMLLPNESINALSMPPAATVCANDFVCDVMPL